VHSPLRSTRLALIAVMAGAILLAPATSAVANPIEPQENSFQSAIDDFAAYLKAETNDAMVAAARIARENKGTLDAAKANIDATISALGETLSGRKAILETLGPDAAAIGEAWRQAAVGSWAKVQRSAADALDWIAAWIRNHPLSDEHSETPV
jgi:hypothetical protein